MTKIGDNNLPPKMATQDTYHKDLEANASKFQNALQAYGSSEGEEKTRLQSMMDDQMKLIQSAVNELKQKEIHKQGVKVAHDYNAYIHSQTDENFSALEHDIQTLKDYNQISTPKNLPE